MPPTDDNASCVNENNYLSKSFLHKALLEKNDKSDAGVVATVTSNKCVHYLFEKQAAKTPDAVALIFQQKELTYRELNERSNQLAHLLRKRGVKEERLVPLCLERSPEMMIGILGILKAGGAYVPIDPGSPIGRMKLILENINTSFVLCSSEVKARLAPASTLEFIELSNNCTFAGYCISNPITKVSQNDLAYVIHTSGSTGNPKGVMIEHGSLLNYLCNSKTKYISDNNNGSGSFVHLSYTFDASITAMFLPLLHGKKIVIGSAKALNAFEDPNLWKHAPYDFIKITPSHLELLKPVLKARDGRLITKKLVIGGEALHISHLSEFIRASVDLTIINEYGPTEATVGCNTYELNTANLPENFDKGLPIGKPIDNTAVYVVGETGELTPMGGMGEICISGAGIARGYLNMPDTTAAKFLENRFDKSAGAVIYKTGDLGRWLPTGDLEYMGRKDDQVKIRGYRIEPGEVENVLLQFELVQQTVVVVQETKNGEKRLQSYYVPNWSLVKAKERTHYEHLVASWKEVYEEEYGRTEAKQVIDEEFNLAGWNDSFTGRAIEKEQMQEWLEDITNLILTDAPQNVLEIGCGMGLIFFQLAGKINHYIGTDLSSSSIKQITKRINKGQRDYGTAEFYTCPAHKVFLKEGEKVDTIIINSIAQYFPGEGYMDDVISKSVSLLKSGGRIIIGDVRDNRLLEIFKLRLQLQKPHAYSTIEELKLIAEQEVLKEEELCFSPEYFLRLQSKYSQITHVDIEWKRGSSINEMTLYRYNVVLYVNVRREKVAPIWQAWEDFSKTSILQQLVEGVEIIALLDAPNPRLWKEKALHKFLKPEEIAGETDLIKMTEREDKETLCIQEILHIAVAKGYHYRLFLDEDQFKVNVLLKKTKSNAFVQVDYRENAPGASIPNTNIPLFVHISSELKKDIRSFLQDQLPEYMIPQDFISLVKLPLTRNGKIDRQLLSRFKNPSEENLKNYVAPSGKVEQCLVAIWQEVLQVNKIGINDNFFELGGNSIHAAILFSRVNKQFNRNLPLATLLTYPTIKELSVVITEKTATIPSSSLVPIQPNGTKTPLFCVHAGGGDVLFYGSLSQHLDDNQPLYALQAKGLMGDKIPYRTLEDMATYYIGEIKKVQPIGPYYLAGYCLGAMISYEMAQQLTKQGEKIALLANFNGVVPLRQLLRIENLQLKSKQATLTKPATAVLSDISELSLKDKLLYPARILKRAAASRTQTGYFMLGYFVYKTIAKVYSVAGLVQPRRVAKTHVGLFLYILDRNYRIKPYNGSMVIFRSPGIFVNPYLGWKKLVKGNIKTIAVAGEHRGRRDILNEPHVQLLAKELKMFLE